MIYPSFWVLCTSPFTSFVTWWETSKWIYGHRSLRVVQNSAAIRFEFLWPPGSNSDCFGPLSSPLPSGWVVVGVHGVPFFLIWGLVFGQRGLVASCWPTPPYDAVWDSLQSPVENRPDSIYNLKRLRVNRNDTELPISEPVRAFIRITLLKTIQHIQWYCS